MEVPERDAGARAVTHDTVSPANRADLGVDVPRVVSDVSVLCPRYVAGIANNHGLEGSLQRVARSLADASHLARRRRLSRASIAVSSGLSAAMASAVRSAA